MRKLFNLFAGMLLLAGVFMTATVNAGDQLPDAGCTANSSAWISASRPNGLLQYFKPEHSQLNKLQAIVEAQSVGQFKISIKKASDASLIYETVITTNSTGTLYLNEDGFDKAVTIGSWYYMQLENVTASVGWHYKGLGENTCDPVGYAYWDGVAQDTDMWFYLWGYNPLVPAPAGDDPVNDNDPVTEPDTTGTEKSTEEAKAEVNVAIEAPVLDDVEKNEVVIDLEDKQIINVTFGDKVTLYGTSPTDATVAIFTGDKAYEVTADADGKWSLEVPVDELAYGENVITAQAKLGDKGSEIVEFITIRLVEGEVIDDITPKAWFMTWGIYHTLVTIGILLLIALLLGVIGYRHHKTKGKPDAHHLFGKKKKAEAKAKEE